MPQAKLLLSLLGAAALASAAQALPVTVLPAATSSASAEGASGTPDTTATPVFAASSTSANAWDVGSAWSIAWGSQHGAYAVRSAAEGVAEAQSFARMSYAITNNGAEAQSYSLFFKIHGGGIGNNLGAALADGELLGSAYETRISVGGALRFSSAASLQHSAAGLIFSRSGTDLSFGADDGLDGFYDWGTAFHRIDLGLLAAGQTVDVVAEFRASATARVGSVAFDCGDPTGPCLAFKGSASASHGADDFFGSAAAGLGEEALRIVPTSAVPEPSGLALAALGLSALVAWRRRG